jgi:hypothetical protein
MSYVVGPVCGTVPGNEEERSGAQGWSGVPQRVCCRGAWSAAVEAREAAEGRKKRKKKKGRKVKEKEKRK